MTSDEPRYIRELNERMDRIYDSLMGHVLKINRRLEDLEKKVDAYQEPRTVRPYAPSPAEREDDMLRHGDNMDESGGGEIPPRRKCLRPNCESQPAIWGPRFEFCPYCGYSTGEVR